MNILNFFAKNIYLNLKEYLEDETLADSIEEIRLRVGKPIILKTNEEDHILKYIVSYKDIVETLQIICENSIYSYQNEICMGFITVKGGHRVGIAGSTVIKDGKVININYISSLNFRIAREIIGCSKDIMPYIINENNSIYNTLIVSPPGVGKTTILRDIVRNLSNGYKNFNGLNIGVVDERGELAATYKGITQNDLGIRTDVLDNVPKTVGMRMLVRSMSPKVIVADEIGSAEDLIAIKEIMCLRSKGNFYSAWKR